MNKTNIVQLILIGALVLALLLSRCSGCKNIPKIISHSDTTYVHDTTTLPGKLVNVPVYVPVKGTIEKPANIPAATTDLATLITDYNNLQETFYSTTTYNDSIKLKDSTFLGKDLGIIHITDKVSKNQILSRDINYKLNFPVIHDSVKITTTNTIIQEAKRQFYIGLGITGNQQNFVNGANASLLYKTKKDHIYSISAGIEQPFGQTSIKPQFSVSTFWKIKL